MSNKSFTFKKKKEEEAILVEMKWNADTALLLSQGGLVSVFVSIHLPDTHYFPLNNSDFAIVLSVTLNSFLGFFTCFGFLVF